VGHGELRPAVLDSGPLVHLAEIGCLRLLRIFESLCIPQAVWLETFGQNRISQNDLGAELNIQHYSVPRSELVNFIAKGNLTELHGGEQECLFLPVSCVLSPDFRLFPCTLNLELSALSFFLSFLLCPVACLLPPVND
jgi:hypothetical protein